MIEKSGDENLLKRKVDDGENVKEKKKKKKVAKSYLDDLWIKLREINVTIFYLVYFHKKMDKFYFESCFLTYVAILIILMKSRF